MTIIFHINFCLLLSHGASVIGTLSVCRGNVGGLWISNSLYLTLYSIAKRFVIERRGKVWDLFQCYFLYSIILGIK